MIPKKILPLTLGGLGVGTTKFIVMGLLQDIAQDLSISIPVAGHLITAYALGVVIGAPLLVAFSTKYPPKKSLIALMISFTVFNGLSALAPEYYSLVFFRFLSGLPHGAFLGIGAVVASRLAEEGKQAQSVAAMFSGLAIANLAMVPLMTYIGHELSWRLAFGLVAILGLLTLFFLKFWLPNLSALNVGVWQELKFFKTTKAWHIISIAAIGFGGLFAWLSYISPLLTNVSGFSKNSISSLMVLAGAGMVVGNFLGGRLADKITAIRAVGLLLLILVAALILVYFFSENQAYSLVLIFTCGALSMAAGSPVNILMLRASQSSKMMASAFMQTALNIANSLGAFLGGLPLVYGFGHETPSLVGAGMAFVGFLLAFLYLKIYRND